jgi:uroporphyrinogen-III synthase
MTESALAGRRVAVLRAGGVHDLVRDALAEGGAVASTIVVATILDRSDDEVRRSVGDLARFRWVAVTSANAARRLELWAHAWPTACHIATVGPATAAIVQRLGLGAPSVADEGTASSLAPLIHAGPALFLAASSARADLARALAARHVELVTVVAYDVIPRVLDAADVATLLDSDTIVAMSPVAIDALCGLDGNVRTAVASIRLVAIGPTTERHAIQRGWRVARTAATREPTSVADAVADRAGPTGARHGHR